MSDTGITVPRENRPDKREAILEAALDLFAERGFHGTAVPLIAAQAKVGAGTVYRYFESKEAIVNALYQQHKQALGQHLLSRVPADQPARTTFHIYWTSLAAFVQQNPSVFQFLELHHHGPYLDERSRAIEEQLTGIARNVLVRFQQEKVVKEGDPNVLMAVVHGAFVGFAKFCSEGRLVMNDESIAAVERCAWEAIRS